MTLRAALYARYSTDNQSSRSVDDQLALCAAFAARAGHVVVQRYADAAVSGQMLAQATAAGDTSPAAAFREVVTQVTVKPGYEIEITGNLAPLTLGGTMVAGEGCERFPPRGPAIPFIIRAAA